MNTETKPHAPPHAAEQVTRALEEDHHKLEALTGQLADAHDRDALTEALEDLARTLKDHFAHEEHAKGFYGIISGKGAELKARTVGLVAEHREILGDLAHLVAVAQERPAPTREIGRAAADLVARLHDHEARELTLVPALA